MDEKHTPRNTWFGWGFFEALHCPIPYKRAKPKLTRFQKAEHWICRGPAKRIKAKSPVHGWKNKKEVKTEGSHLPGWGGVLLGIPSAAMQPCPARQVCGLTR
jgi:hypothetical protein